MSAIVDRAFPVDPADLLPPRTADNDPFWSALEEGELALQVCADCSAFRYPIVPVCPKCGSRSSVWRATSGRGTVFSWVRYHRSYLPEFEPLVPYVVATLQLAEGPRLFALIRGRHDAPRIGEEVVLQIERWPGGRCIPAFVCISGGKE